MAEMLICTIDQVNKDPKLDAMSYKRGDVIEIMADHHGWGTSELRNVERVIITVPNVDVESLTGFLAQEPGDPMKNPYLRRRAFKFDIDSYDGLSLNLEKTLSLQKAK